MTDQPFRFNLWHEPWIRVMRPDGASETLGIGACLAQAHTLQALHDPSPLVVAGVHRLLTAILQFIYQPNDLDDLEALLEAGQFDHALLEQFAAQYAERFDLFHPTAPFLQTGDVAVDAWVKPTKSDPKEIRDAWVEPSAATKLFAEIPSSSERAHYHHGTDDSQIVCPTCCARGLITMPAFARAEGGGSEGYKPSINGVPPIYVLPIGNNLFQSLALSIVTPDFMPKTADLFRADVTEWNRDAVVRRKHETSSVGYIESLTFPVRKIRLFPRFITGLCTVCGTQTMVAVQQIYFKMGMSLSKGVENWRDPFVAMQGRGDKEPGPVQPQAGKEFWREYSTLLLNERQNQLRPSVISQLGRLATRLEDYELLDISQPLRFRCIGLRTDQAKIEAWQDESLETPLALLHNPDSEFYVTEALERANHVERILNETFNRYFRPKRKQNDRTDKLARFKTIRARMTAGYWQALAPLFRLFIRDLAPPETRDANAKSWVNEIMRAGWNAFKDASSQVGERAEALRARVEAEAACSRRLMAKRKEWIGDSE